MKKSFVLYIDNYEPIKLLTLVQKGQLLDYMFRYNLGIEIDIDDPVLKMAFSFFEQTFIRDNKKWNDTAERNRKNGSKGGRPIKNDSNNLDDNPKNPEEPSGLLDNPENPVGARKAVSVSVSVSGIGSGIDIKEKDLLSDSPESDKKEKIISIKKNQVQQVFEKDIVEFVTGFQKAVFENNGAKAPRVTDALIKSGSDSIDKLIRLDGFSKQVVFDSIRWAYKDSFWSNKVFSLSGIREKGKSGLTKFQNIVNAKESKPQNQRFADDAPVYKRLDDYPKEFGVNK